MLTADGLTLQYSTGGARSNAVDDVSLAVPSGSFTGVIGPSGSGKSSLLYLLSGLNRPTRGRVVYDGLDYARLGASALLRLRRRRYGFIFQQHFLINFLSVLENVLVGAPQADREHRDRALALIDRVGLSSKLRLRPHQLSIGERQRVAVARALVHRPAVVFADEPTASLDQATGRHVVSLLTAYRDEQGGSVVVVTHDPAMLTGADQVLSLRDGRLS